MDLEIKCGFNSNDETLNFGSRGLADNESYEAVTLATVKTSENSEGKPIVNASRKNGEIFYSVNNFLGIFKDKEYSALKFSCTFQCIVDVMCISLNNLFLFIFLRDGSLQVLKYYNGEYNLMGTVHVVECAELDNEKLFFGSYIEDFEENAQSTELSLIVVTKKGHILRVNVVDVEGSDTSTTSKLLYDLGSTIEVSSFGNSSLFLKGSRMWLVDFLTDNTIFNKAIDIKYACFCDLNILALSHSGKLFHIDSFNLCYYLIEMDSPLQTISLLVDERSITKWIIAETEKNESDHSYLQLLQSDFSVVYSLKLSSEILIINPESETDEVHYISFVKSDNRVDELRFHCIYETDPEKRLFRLFRRKMFDEAERFAKTHNIDISIVNKEKAKLIVEKLECTSKDIDDLIDILNSLDDKEFILDCCNNADSTCLSSEDVLKILKYGCDLEIDKKDLCAKDKQFICNGLYVRIHLLLSIGYEMEKWNVFSTCCLVSELKNLLRQEQITKAIIIFTHLGIQEVENLDQNCIEGIIDILSELNLDVVIPFLPTFIPITLHHLPNTLPLFMNWLEMRIFQMENRYNDNFPQNAIDFLQNTVEYLRIEKATSTRNSEMTKIKNLQILLKALNALKVLRCSYGIKIALKEFVQERKAVVKILLNLDLAPTTYNMVLQEFTYRFILENHLNPDDILWDELIDILNCQESYWENIVGSILNCISSITLKLEAVERILLIAKLPWSNIVRQLGKQMLDSSHPATLSIENLMKKESMLIVLKKKEYCFSSDIDTNNLSFLVKRVIYCNLPTLISDAFHLCEEKENFKIEVMRLLFHHFVKEGNFGKALEVIDGGKALVEKCLKLILEDITELLATLDSSTSDSQNYIYALNIITQKYYSLTEDEYEKFCWKKKVELLKSVQNLNTHFNINVSVEIVQVETKKILINNLIRNMVESYEDGLITTADILESCNRLSSDTGVNKEKLLLQCCMRVDMDKNDLLCKTAEDLLCNCDKVKYLCVLTVYLLHNLDIKKGNQVLENSFIDYTTSTLKNNSIRTLKLALSLITKAVANAVVEELAACLHIVPWVNSIYFLKKNKTAPQQNFDDLEDDIDIENFNPSSGSLAAIQKMFSIYTSFIAQYKGDEYYFLTYFNRQQDKVSQEEFLDEIKDFGKLIHILNQDGESLLSYKLLTTLQNQLKVHEDLDVIIKDTLSQMIRNQCIPNLMNSSVVIQDVDENLLYTSLLWCDSNETEKHIEHAMKLHKYTPNKIISIAKIGVKIFDYHQNIGPKNFCKQVLLTVSWWNKLKHLNLEYNRFFKASSRRRLELLINNDHFDFKQIKQYCSDYNLTDSHFFYLEYLKICLLNWRPKYKVVTNNTGTKTLVMEENQEEQLYQKCMHVKHFIDEKEKIEELLQKLWSQVNFYHYEVFTCILDISEGHSYKHLKSMLLFLKKYDRINIPSDTEKEKWFNSFPESQFIDPLSEFRLLFNSTLLDSKDIWNVIRKEISLRNYTVWFEAVDSFTYLTVDDICSFLVKELVGQGVLNAIEPGEWLYPKYTSLFAEVDNCLQHMDNVDMKKTTAAYCLLSNTPEGADQVTIAKITYRYALEYKNQEPKSPNLISFTKIERKYQRCLSLQILHIHQLADQSYIDFILNIEQLLMALYHDERIISQSEHINLLCPDINQAAEQLAEVFGLDIIKFRKKLITDYLADSDFVELHGSMALELSRTINYSDNSQKSEYNLKRAAYICSSDVIFWRKHLLEHGDILNYSNDSSNFYYRSRCLKCLLEITDHLSIEILTSLDFQSFMNIVDQLTLNSILSKFGMQVDLENMKSWSAIAKKLAQIGNPDSIKALAQFCKVLKISKAKYWEYIIRSANHISIFSDLKEYLDYSKGQDFRYEKFYVEAWQRVIDHMVTETLTLDEKQFEENILKDIFMIQQCPVLYMLNLECSLKKCVQANKWGVAAILMQYVPRVISLEVAKEIKNSDKLVNLLKEVQKFESSGVATVVARKLLFSL